jgi:hypothetical protein
MHDWLTKVGGSLNIGYIPLLEGLSASKLSFKYEVK